MSLFNFFSRGSKQKSQINSIPTANMESLEPRLLLAGTINISVTDLITNNTTPTIRGTVSDPNATVNITVGGNTYEADNNGNGTWTLFGNELAGPLAEGEYDVLAVATNTAAGTYGYDTDPLDLTIDTTAPTVTVDDVVTDEASPELTGVLNDEQATVTIKIGTYAKTYTAALDYDDNGVFLNSWTLESGTITALPLGTYTVTVTAKDKAGNESVVTGTLEVTTDRILVTFDELITADSTPELTGTVSDADAVVRVLVDGAYYDAVNNGDGTWTLADDELADLDDGSYDVLVIASNSVTGYSSYDLQSNGLKVDTTKPVVTVNFLTTEDTTPKITGTVTDATNVTIVVTVNGVDYTVDEDDIIGSSWSYEIDTPLAVGTYNVIVTATDEAGNTGTDKTTNELKILVRPKVTIDDTDGNDNGTLNVNSASPVLSGTIDDPDASVVVTIDNTDYNATNNGDGTWTLAAGIIDVLDDDGTYSVTVTATNTANVKATASISLILDTDTPGTPTFDGPLTTSNPSPQLTGTYDDTTATVTVTINGKDYKASYSQMVEDDDGATVPQWKLPSDKIDDLGEGTYSVTVSVSDAAGNSAVYTLPDGLTIVLTPTVTIDGDDEDEGYIYTNDRTPTITGTVDTYDAEVTVTIGGVGDFAAVNNGNGTWTLDGGDIALLAEGEYDVTVTAVSGIYTGTATGTLVVDVTKPSSITVNPLYTSFTRPQLTGTVSETDAEIQIGINGRYYEATNNGDGTWTLDADTISALSAGTYSIDAYAIDKAGNYIVDETTKELIVTSQASVTLISGGIRTLVYKEPDGTKVTIQVKAAGAATFYFDANSFMNIVLRGTRYYLECESGAVLDYVYMSRGAVEIKASGGADGLSTVNEIRGTGELSYFKAKKTDLVGNGINISSGVIQKIYLNSLQADITMKGRSSGVSIYVAKAVEGSNINITGSNIKTFKVGAMINSSLLVGVMGTPDTNDDDVVDLVHNAALVDGYEIKTVKITGYKNSVGDLYANSNIAASEIKKVTIYQITVDNDDEDFGICTNLLGKLIIKQDGVKYVYGSSDWYATLADDFTVRVV